MRLTKVDKEADIMTRTPLLEVISEAKPNVKITFGLNSNTSRL